GGTAKDFRNTRTRIDRAPLFAGEVCQRVCRSFARTRPNSGRISSRRGPAEFWPLEPEQPRAGAFGRRRHRHFSAEERPNLGPDISLRLLLQKNRTAIHASSGPVS